MLLPAIILAILLRVIFLRGKESLSVAISAFAPRLMFLWRKIKGSMSAVIPKSGRGSKIHFTLHFINLTKSLLGPQLSTPTFLSTSPLESFLDNQVSKPREATNTFNRWQVRRQSAD